MSIQDFINRYVKGISEDEMVDICVSVGIQMTKFNKNFTLSDKEVARLKNNSRINTHIVNREIISRHEGLLENYDKMISHYDALLAVDPKNPSKTKILPQDRPGLQAIRDRLVSERDKYQTFIDGLNRTDSLDHTSALFMNQDAKSLVRNPIKQVQIFANQKKLDKKSEKMNDLYGELDEIEDKLGKAKTSYLRAKYAKEARDVRKKIQKLRTKSGRIQRKQRQLVGEGIRRYKKQYQKKIAMAAIELERESQFATQRKAVQMDVANIPDDMKTLQDEKKALEKDSPTFENQLRIAAIERDMRKLERLKDKVPQRMNKLQRVNGRYRAVASVGRTIDNVLHR